ncbi:MAG: 5'-methylthioadenosine/adenosylhomocysteine nucleosidase [Acutalibacteraceae bacterium]|nr:5'-methylthioadenosine/adenosylhomocysteine nucleosidase [Acutalibacteraceae bacterium]
MIGIIGALDIEIAGIKALMTDVEEKEISKTVFYKGKINGKDCVLAQCGVGKVNAAMCAQTMILSYKPNAVINTGVAGAVNQKLHIGDIVVSSRVVHHDAQNILDEGQESTIYFPRGTIQFSDEMITEIPANKELAEKLLAQCKDIENISVYSGTVASGDQFISGRQARLEIGEFFDAYCCEMEGASIGQVCYRNDTPFAILRAISDTIDDNDYMDFEKFKYIATDETLKVIREFFDIKAE